ncbi:hypothetical protein KR093_005720 [Drosophila rubida]|uniref:Uncharacterized protein n=1 Tax=Drosophila rubida TaxID=30044 RepID=A0AAD4JTH0_9MUSC|nr:hypothetical protein KR093_005720 [Drosophila rubida]
MSTARFARSGRARICILMSMFIVLIMMIVIYHMSQQQLDETRAFRLRCEQNQEGLNMQLQGNSDLAFTLCTVFIYAAFCPYTALSDDKLSAEKKLEVMHSEKQRMQDEYEKQQDSERSLKKKYDDQLGKYKTLDAKHNDLKDEYAKSKKQHMDDKNSLLLQVQQLQQEKKQHDMSNWKDKYETLLRDTEHKIHNLESALSECKAHCGSAPPAQLNKPSDLLTSDTTPARRSSPAQLAHSIEKPRNEKSFNEQVKVSQGLYKIGVSQPSQQPTNSTTKPQGGGVEQQKDMQPLQSFDVRNNHSLILNSVENFQIAPKSLQTIGDEPAKQEQPVKAANVAPVSPLSAPQRKSSSSTPNTATDLNASVAPKLQSSSSSSTGQPPLAIPPAKPSAEVKVERKLPENVAPIPDNFDGKGEAAAADPDTAAEELPKNENNNRYANVVNELESNKNLGDSGGHEVKDALNEQNLNFPGANPNLFDGDLAAAHAPQVDNKMLAADAAAVGGGGGGDDDDDVMLGDVAVKQHILDGDNLNNEIAADQGKEFADAVHLEDNMDEDQDGN